MQLKLQAPMLAEDALPAPILDDCEAPAAQPPGRRGQHHPMWPAPPQPAEDDFDLDREIEYAFESDESLGVRSGDTE